MRHPVISSISVNSSRFWYFSSSLRAACVNFSPRFGEGCCRLLASAGLRACSAKPIIHGDLKKSREKYFGLMFVLSGSGEFFQIRL